MVSKYRQTKARKAIIKIFEDSPLPLTAQEVNKIISVNKTTIYRELDFLVKQNLLTQINFGDGLTRFEKIKDHHHHLICDKCGKVEEVVLDESILFQPANKVNFTVTRHSLEFFGQCGNCR
jgi:Fe2+ or Zn2+ uptake regulation protein